KPSRPHNAPPIIMRSVRPLAHSASRAAPGGIATRFHSATTGAGFRAWSRQLPRRSERNTARNWVSADRPKRRAAVYPRQPARPGVARRAALLRAPYEPVLAVARTCRRRGFAGPRL